MNANKNLLAIDPADAGASGITETDVRYPITAEVDGKFVVRQISDFVIPTALYPIIALPVFGNAKPNKGELLAREDS